MNRQLHPVNKIKFCVCLVVLGLACICDPRNFGPVLCLSFVWLHVCGNYAGRRKSSSRSSSIITSNACFVSGLMELPPSVGWEEAYKYLKQGRYRRKLLVQKFLNVINTPHDSVECGCGLILAHVKWQRHWREE